MSSYKEILVWFIAVYNLDIQKIKISVRSSGVDINNVALKYGGGGHSNAAAAWLNS